MEIQIGQALQTHSSIKGFDPHNYKHGECSENKKYVENKRSFEESLGHFFKPLPMLVWNGRQPNEEDDHVKKMNRNVHATNNEGENHLVGWPPIKSWRKKELHQQHPNQIRIDHRMQGNENQRRWSKLHTHISE
ncbi:auxin-responsive protein IAA29-like [Vicia villosa]|uniref:auxin-responsive protein IAA29-like n=1 Tax=Vicia villosa TaxID=3911 RepID=UPI00273AD517|nr:auxin-responsive protein IAA29-like [Vicia villosa]